jgi:hypothetical protein
LSVTDISEFDVRGVKKGNNVKISQ